MSSLHLHLLGGLVITQNDAPVTQFMSAKVPALLAYLAVARRAHSRDSLATLLWGELPDADAKNNLRQALSNLKKLFEPQLDIARETVAFNTGVPYKLDVQEFEKLTADRQGTADDDETAVRRLRSAVGLYRGDFLDGFFVRDAPEFEEWMLAQRTRLRERALNALQTLTEFHMARGEYREANEYAARLLEMDAWREEAHRISMLCYARSGQRSAALEQYRKCRAILQREFGVKPSAETNALYKRIRAAGETPRHNLRTQPTPFVGRVRELAQLQEKLLQAACRMVTLVGIGGIGKTRLALEVSARLLKQGAFLDGVYFVSLSAVGTEEAMLTAIADALGIAAHGNLDTALVEYLRAKEILLTLDNFEQLVESAPRLGELLQSAPHLKLLITSRERLNVQWEWVNVIEGLEYPLPGASVVDASLPALRLFLERAQRVQPYFQFTPSELAAAVRIAQLVEELPLALELAAAAVNHHACADIANELERNLNFLETTLRDVPARQRSLRAVFEYSWNLLNEREREVWRKLSVFQNGWTPEAARAIADASQHDLNALADKSLVRVQAARYDMHELARQYAREKLKQRADENAATRARHSEFFAVYVSARESALKGAGDQSALNAITKELANVLAGWEWAWTIPQWQSIRAYMEPLLVVLEMRGQFALGARLYEQARGRVEALRKCPPEAARVLGQLLIREGWMRFRLGEFAKTIELVERGLPLLENANDEYEIAYGLLFMGAAEWGRGAWESSQRYLSQS